MFFGIFVFWLVVDRDFQLQITETQYKLFKAEKEMNLGSQVCFQSPVSILFLFTYWPLFYIQYLKKKKRTSFLQLGKMAAGCSRFHFSYTRGREALSHTICTQEISAKTQADPAWAIQVHSGMNHNGKRKACSGLPSWRLVISRVSLIKTT